MGLDMTDPSNVKYVKKAWDVIKGKSSEEFLSTFLKDDAWQKYMKQYPGIFQKTYGFSGDKVLSIK